MAVSRGFLRFLSTVLTLGLFLAVLVAGPVVRGVGGQAEPAAASELAAAKKKVRKGRIKVVLTGTGSYTIKRKGFRKTAATSKTFRVKPGRYRIKAPGATVKPRKVTVRAGKTVKVRVTFSTPTPTPAPTPTPTPTPPPPTPPKINPDTITAGGNHTCGLDTSGKAWCWGYDFHGELGDGNDGQGDEYSPVPVASSLAFTLISAGAQHTCALDTTGRAWCWGYDLEGELGDGDDGGANEYSPVPVADNHTFTHLTAGVYHTCALDTTGKVWCWGTGDARLGSGAGGPPYVPSPTPVTGTGIFTHVSAGGAHTCGLDNSGKAWCWGSDDKGQLGDGNDGQGNEYAPVPIASSLTFTQLMARGDHTCAIDSSGKAWCWGYDAAGQLGDGNDGQGNEYAPVPVAGDHLFAHLGGGFYVTCGVDSDGKAWCWGMDHYGQVGDGDDGQGNEYAPVPVAGDHTFTHLAAGAAQSCGIDTSGKGWCWGYDYSGQLGDGDDGQASEYAPVAVAGDHTFATTY